MGQSIDHFKLSPIIQAASKCQKPRLKSTDNKPAVTAMAEQIIFIFLEKRLLKYVARAFARF